MVVEICANSAASCIEAQKGGAARVELCAAMPEGGTTPSWGEMVARQSIDIDMNVIIRPRRGDFYYDQTEFQAMLYDIEAARRAGANGVVFGCLLADGSLDRQKNSQLIEAAQGMTKTFHRAFDVCYDPFRTLEQLIILGFDRLLTSGQQPTAIEGAELISKLISQAAGRIIVMPGCGVNEDNIALLAQTTGAKEFHFSARESLQSEMVYRNERVSMGGVVKIDEFTKEVTSAERVANTIKRMQSRKQ